MTLHKLNPTSCRWSLLIMFMCLVPKNIPEIKAQRYRYLEMPSSYTKRQPFNLSPELANPCSILEAAYLVSTSNVLVLGGITWINKPTHVSWCDFLPFVCSVRMRRHTTPPVSCTGPALLIPLCSSSIAFLAVTNGMTEKQIRVRDNTSLSLGLTYQRDLISEC